MVGFGLWVAYGTASRDLPLIVPNCVAFLVMGCTIAVALDKGRGWPHAISAGPAGTDVGSRSDSTTGSR
jgi:hypothetical protein